mgnify:CR=1 FL=1
MNYYQLHTKEEVDFYLNDIVHGCKVIAKKNALSSTEHLLNMISWNIELPNCFFLIGEHRKRCVGFLFALGITYSDKAWCEVIGLWTLPKLATKIKYTGDAMDLLLKWCKDKNISTIVTNITRNLKSHEKALDGVYMKWLKDLGFEEIGKVIRLQL